MTKGRFEWLSEHVAATGVNAEQASKRVMRRPTRRENGEGSATN